MSLARQAINEFSKDGEVGDMLAIQTIETSFKRDLELFLNAVSPNIIIVERLVGEISEESKESWTGDFDSEDWEGCDHHCFIMEFKAVKSDGLKIN